MSIDQIGRRKEREKKKRKRWSNYADSHPRTFISIKFVRSTLNQCSFSAKLIPYVVVSKKRCSYSILFELLPFIRPCRTIRSLVHRVLIVTLRKKFVTIHSPPLSSKTLLVSKIKQPIRKIGDRGRYISSLNSSYGEISPFPRGPADDPSPHPEDKLTNFSPRISRRSSIRVSYDFQPREEWLIVPIVSSPRLSPTSDRLIILSPPSPLRGDAKSGVEIATNYPPPPILTFVNRCPCLPSFIELKSNIHPGYYFVKPSRPWWINFNCSRSAQWKEGTDGLEEQKRRPPSFIGPHYV